MGADTPKYVQGNSTESARKSTVAKPINIKTGKIIVLLVVGVAARWHYVYFNRPRVSKQSKTEIELVKLIRYSFLEFDYFELNSSIFLAICAFSFRKFGLIDQEFNFDLRVYYRSKIQLVFSEVHRTTVAPITCHMCLLTHPCIPKKKFASKNVLDVVATPRFTASKHVFLRMG